MELKLRSAEDLGLQLVTVRSQLFVLVQLVRQLCDEADKLELVTHTELFEDLAKEVKGVRTFLANLQAEQTEKRVEGAVYQRSVSDTHEVVVFPSLLGGGKLCYARKGEESSEQFYDYPRLVSAIAAAKDWGGGYDDPGHGWVRHFPSCRRRPDGTAASEKIEP